MADQERHACLPKSTPVGVAIPGGEAFDAGPFTAGEIAVHAVGGALNAILCSLAVAYVATHLPERWWVWSVLLGAVLVGIYVADLASGILHWAFDTWLDEKSTVRRMVLIVREHHVYPQLIFKYPLRQEIGLMSWFGLFGLAPGLVVAVVPGEGPVTRLALVVGGLSFSLLVAFSLELHKVGHRARPGRAIRTLQRLGLVLSTRHHMRHHAGEHDTHYCIVTGWADLTLGRLGLFRGLEFCVGTLAGAVPRANDREWRRRYGRWVSPIPRRRPATPARED